MNNLRTNQRGFTLIELLFATVVFSFVLIICMTALVQIGRTYYKGVTTAKTQEATRNVIDEIAQSIQFSGSAIRVGTVGSAGPEVVTNAGNPRANYGFICIGNKRISYVLDRQLKSSGASEGAKQSPHALWVDEYINCATDTAVAPADLTQSSPSSGRNGREILGENMRLTRLELNEVVAGSGVWTVRVGVAYGDQDLIEYADTNGDGTGDLTRCVEKTAGSEFCAQSYLSSTVKRRVQ